MELDVGGTKLGGANSGVGVVDEPTDEWEVHKECLKGGNESESWGRRLYYEEGWSWKVFKRSNKGREMRKNVKKTRELVMKAVSEGGTSNFSINLFVSELVSK